MIKVYCPDITSIIIVCNFLLGKREVHISFVNTVLGSNIVNFKLLSIIHYLSLFIFQVVEVLQ